MKKQRTRKIFVTGLLFAGICLFGNSVICQAEEKTVLSSDSQVSTWQEDNAKTNIEITQNQEEIEVAIDTSEVTEKYEMFLLFVISEELFSVEKTEAIAIDYSYEGSEPLYVTLEMNDAKGGKLFTEGACSYIEVVEDKNYLCQMENGQITLSPGASGTLVIPVGEMQQSDADFESFYGMTLSCLAEQMDESKLYLKEVKAVSNEVVEQYSEMKGVYIDGSSQISIPYMGTYWFDYSMVGSKGTFQAEELPTGCTLEENGRLVLTADAKEGEVVLDAEVGNGFYVKKVIQVNEPIDMGYELKEPQEMEKVTHSLSFLSKEGVLPVLRMVLFVVNVLVIILFLWVKIKIRKDMKATEEEEMF